MRGIPGVFVLHRPGKPQSRMPVEGKPGRNNPGQDHEDSDRQHRQKALFLAGKLEDAAPHQRRRKDSAPQYRQVKQRREPQEPELAGRRLPGR